MPKFLEDTLRSQAHAEGKSGRAADRYVYGTMNNMGAMHGNRETAKGRSMERKHERTLHPALAARATQVKAAHAHLSKTVPGFTKQSMRDQMKAHQNHIRRTSKR